jgi:phage terminase large subunit-like protein
MSTGTLSRSSVPRGCYAPDAIPSKWEPLVFGIPGYDPTRGADGFWFDPKVADKAVRFFSVMLQHIEGGVAGKPFDLEPWQAAIVANLFGWMRRDRRGNAVRRYRELFVYVPRKNGKTPLCAGIGLFCFFCDKEAGQQGYIAAKDREQAGHLFRQMEHMVRANPELASKCRIYGGNAQGGQSRSFVKSDASFLKVISGDGGGKHGGNPHIVIVDELHEQQNRDLLDALRTSMVSANRSQSLMISLTTADHDRDSVCNEKYLRAKSILANPEEDTAFLPVIYEADPTDDPYDPAVWRRVNPNLDVSVSEDELKRIVSEAKANPALWVEFLRLHLNLRTRQVIDNAIDMVLWDACGEPFDPSILIGQPCWAGMDFGWTDDYCALVFVFPIEDRLYVLPHFWVPQDGRRDLRKMPTAGFVASGHVTVCDGQITDVEQVYEVLRDARLKYDLRLIAVDGNNAKKQFQDLMAEGFTPVSFHQNKGNYSEPWKWLMANGLQAGQFRHGGHPVLRWMAGNTASEVDGLDGVMPKKKKSAEKIDGVCAAAMAIGVWLNDPNKPTLNDAGGFDSW